MLLWLLCQAPTDRVNPINVTLTAVYRSIDSSLASDARTIQFGGYPALELKAAVEVEAIIPLFVAGDVTQGCPLHHLIRSRKEARATAWSRLLTWTTPWGEASSWPSVPKSTNARRPPRPASLSYVYDLGNRGATGGRGAPFRVHASRDAARLRGRGLNYA